MRLAIAAIGRLKSDGEKALIARYQKRLAAGRAIAIGPLEIEEFAESRAGLLEARRAEEANRLLAATQNADRRIALDEGGKAITSQAFAKLLATCRDEGVRELAFLIGGPDGHDPRLLAQSAFTLSLGPMTLPHGLARVVLVEQLYRAVTILSGHPYHRG